jgi:hypothetical protein
MEVVEVSFKIQTTSWIFGMFVTFLRNHMYKITQLQRKDKYGVLQKKGKRNHLCNMWRRCKQSTIQSHFRRRNLDLFLTITQGFKVGCAKGLCPTLKEAPTRSMWWWVSRRFQGNWCVKMRALGLKARTQITRYGLPKCPSISFHV